MWQSSVPPNRPSSATGVRPPAENNQQYAVMMPGNWSTAAGNSSWMNQSPEWVPTTPATCQPGLSAPGTSLVWPSDSNRNGSVTVRSLLPENVIMPIYYYPQLFSMNELLSFMSPYANQDGYFLVRNSFSKPGKITISVIHERGVKHFNVVQENGMFSVVENRQFPSLHELVAFYGENDVPNLDGIVNIKLKFPIMPPSSGRTASQSSLRSERTSEAVDSFMGDAAVSANRVCATRHGSLDDIVPRTATNRDVIGRAGGDCSRWRVDHASQNSDSDCHSEGAVHSAAPHRFSIGGRFRQLLRPRKLANSVRDDACSVSQPSSSDSDMLDRRAAVTPSASRPAGVSSKPPAPLPASVAQSTGQSPPAFQPTDNVGTTSPSASSKHYSSLRDVEQPLSTMLIAKMRHEEDAYRCECGLHLDEAELPRGWKMHLSMEPETAGVVFFTSPDNRTSWTLPLEVCIELEPEQQNRIRSLLQASGGRPSGEGRKKTQSSNDVAAQQTLSPRNYPNVPLRLAEESVLNDERLGIPAHAQSESDASVTRPEFDLVQNQEPITSARQISKSGVYERFLNSSSSDVTSELSASSSEVPHHSVRLSKIYYV